MNREDFPILSNKNLIYFDNGATTLKPKCVLDVINDYNTKFTANAHRGDYEISYRVDLAYEGSRDIIAKFINDYNSGITPNPCILCNREVKFNFLYQNI